VLPVSRGKYLAAHQRFEDGTAAQPLYAIEGDMATQDKLIEEFANREYEHGFVTEVEQDTFAPGLDEDVIRRISAKKDEPEWMLEWRLKAYRHWLEMTEPKWPNVHYPEIDYQAISYFAAPAKKLESLDEVDPEILATYEKLGIPLGEQKILAGVAVDAVFDSVSVATTFKEKLGELGIVFCSFSEAVHEHPELVKKYLGSVVPTTDNFFATLNSAVFSDGSFVYIPEGVRCPMELSTYFRINAANTGQFERTLIIADKGAYVSYLEGCTAPMRDENQLHAAVVELVALENAQIKYSTVQNWYPGDKETGAGGIFNFVTKDLLDPGRDRFGHHLEVPERDPQGRRHGRRVLLGGPHGRPPTGRHRVEDDPPRQEHLLHNRLQRNLGSQRTEHLPRSRKGRQEGGQRPQFFAVRLDADRRPLRRPHLSLYRDRQSDRSDGARGNDLEDRRRPDLLLQPARHRNRGCGVDDRQRFLQRGLPRAADGVRGRSAKTPGREPGRQCRMSAMSNASRGAWFPHCRCPRRQCGVPGTATSAMEKLCHYST
jgi:Fe-S cluster assembly scaffold protein SufB